MFEKTGTAIGVLILLMLICIIILAVITVSSSMRLTRMANRYNSFMRGKDGASMEEVILDKFDIIDKLDDRSRGNLEDIGVIRERQNKTLNHYGIVKYDAFDDVGGKMSFALAMLDSENSGFILDTIHSKDNCFLYLKEIVKGESYIMLSKEEIEALKIASDTYDESDLEI